MDFNIDIDKIKNYIYSNNLTKAKFCKLSKLSISTLNRIFNGQNFKTIALFKIAKTMGIQVHQLFLNNNHKKVFN